MKLLVDANLSPVVVAELRVAGFDATHVADHGLVTASDRAIARFAARERYVVVSADSDFATILALSIGTAPSLVLLRSADHLTPPQQAALLAAHLGTVEADLLAGSVVSIHRGRLRVRRLPLTRLR